MYMRIAWVQTEPGQASKYEEEFKRVYFADNMRSVFLGQAHDNPDSLFIVTLWDSAEAIEEWDVVEHHTEIGREAGHWRAFPDAVCREARSKMTSHEGAGRIREAAQRAMILFSAGSVLSDRSASVNGRVSGVMRPKSRGTARCR